MKILHVITSLYTGGAERLMVELLPRLKERGIEADLCLFNGAVTPFYNEILDKGVKVFDFGAGNNVYSPINILLLRKLMRNYDIIHTHNTSPQFFAALANTGFGKHLITTEHNTFNRRRKWPGFAAIDRLMYNRYDAVISISDKAEENLRTFLGDCKAEITTIYNGINVKKFAEAKPASILHQMMPEDGKAIIMVAGFRPQKDQPTLIRAMKYLPDRFHLFFVGSGSEKSKCESLAEEMNLGDRVRFLGQRTDIPNLLKESDFVVMSSHYEGLSLSSVEGMSVGKPFLASDVDGLKEVVKGAGILFPHEDSKAFADEILKLDKSNSLYNEVAERCFDRARKYDISTMVDQYIDVYNHTLSKQSILMINGTIQI